VTADPADERLLDPPHIQNVHRHFRPRQLTISLTPL
jgi:hypothetical protein